MSLPFLREPEAGDLLKQVRLLGLPASDEALDLLRERRRVRRLGTVWATPGLALAAVLCVLGFQAESATQSLCYYVALSLTVTVSILVRHEAIRRAERRLGAVLPRRLSRTSAVSVATVLGVRVLVVLAAVVVLHVAMVVVLLARGDVAAAVGFGSTCVAAYLLSVLALFQVAGRAVLAVDPLTLAVDDRLRTRDATVTYLPVLLASVMFAVVTRGATDMTTFYLAQAANGLTVVSTFVRDARWKQTPPGYHQWRGGLGSQR